MEVLLYVGALVLGIGLLLAGLLSRRNSDSATAEEAGEAAAASIRSGIYGFFAAIGGLTLGFCAALTRPIPKLGELIWKKVALKALYHYHRAHGGDRTGLEVTPSNRMQLTPVAWKGPDQLDDDEKPGWRAKGRDKIWDPTTLGQTGPRLGKTPVMPLDSDSWKATSVLEARVAEAVDMGEKRPLYRVDEANMTATLDTTGGAGANPAVADGGATVTNIEFDPRTSPIFEDVIIDLGSDDYDGQAVSWLKTKELMAEHTTTDEMHNQEERGFLAGRSRKNMMRWMWKIFLVAGLVAIGGLIGKELVFTIFGGGGGGGGGGMVPLMLSPLL